MRKILFVILMLFLSTTSSFAHKGRCGTEMLIQHNKALRADPSLAARTAISKIGICEPEDFYDTVYSKDSKHFQVFYTLDGPHKTTPEFVDSLIAYAEFAYGYHTKKLGMRAPKGQTKTIHYLQDVEDGLYPIEVIDIDNLRNSRFWLGGICHGCFGITVPHSTETGASELLIDNDFRYTPQVSAQKKDSVNYHDKVCKYAIASEELFNTRYDYSYAVHWKEALRVTTVHELYHAAQIRYVDLFQHSSFWFEASASGIEEIVVPDIDDYYSYLPTMFQMAGVPLNKTELAGDPGLYANLMYGSGIFLMYLSKFVDKKIDSFIWENFSKKPDESFEKQFVTYTNSRNLSADSIFHDFATRLAFSGKKTSFLDSSQWIVSDQYFWPDFNYIENTEPDTSSDDSIRYFYPQLEKMAYQFYMKGEPDLMNFKGKASIILFKGDSAEISRIPTVYNVSPLYSEASIDPAIDSIGWIFSRFSIDSFYPVDTKIIAMHAYPMPWREGNLCFTPLPENKKFVEIRNRRGDLVTREKYNGRTLCLDETSVRNMMTPGVYRFRAGNTGKTKDFLIIY